MTVETTKPSEAHSVLKSGCGILIDVRTPAEFEEIHAVGARLQPLDKLDLDAIKAACSDPDKTCVYFICRSGKRATTAAEKLCAAGLSNAKIIEGGTDAWAAEGLPVNRGQKAMSLERQVRIAAGSLVLLGVILAWLVHPYLIGISAFVGAGLVFAGVTDTCGMGMMLAKMPWNQRRGCSGEACSLSGT